MNPFNPIVRNLATYYQIPKIKIRKALERLYLQHNSLKVAEAILIQQLLSDFGHCPKSFYPGIDAVNAPVISNETIDFQAEREKDFEDILSGMHIEALLEHLEEDDKMINPVNGEEMVSARGLFILTLAAARLNPENSLAVFMANSFIEKITANGYQSETLSEELESEIMALSIIDLMNWARDIYGTWISQDEVLEVLEASGAKMIEM